MTEQDKPAFEVTDGLSGHKWKVYENGRTEGFPPGCLIVNRIPLIARIEAYKLQAATT